jgi:hypothetical protein
VVFWYSISLFGAFAKLGKAIISFAMSVRLSGCPFFRMEQLGSTGRIFMKFDVLAFFENLSKELKFR